MHKSVWWAEDDSFLLAFTCRYPLPFTIVKVVMKVVQKVDQRQTAVEIALEDVVLVIVYMCENQEYVIERDTSIDVQCKDIMRGNGFYRLLDDWK